MPGSDSERPRRRAKACGVVLAGLIAVASLILVAITHEPKTAVSSPVPATAAIVPQIADTKSEAEVVFRGKSSASFKRNAIMYFGGQVSEMPITEGQMVNEGDMLASYKMDRPSMMEIHQILYAEGVLGLKRALFDQEIALDKLTNISLPLKKSRLERLEKEVADLKQLQARNMAPEAAVDLKEREVDAAKKEIVEVKESIKQAEDSIKKTKKDLQFGEDRRKRALDLLEWQTNRSYTDPDSKVPLDVAFLKAPITGQVVWIAPMARVGAELPKGFHAMTLHPKDGIVVRCKVHELDLVKLKTGDRGTVSFDAFPEKEYACKVSRIPWVSRNPILEMPADYEIECSLEKTEATFQEGLTCNVKVRITQ